MRNATLLVRDGRVIAAGAASRVRIPANAERVSLAGKVIMPGLINTHGHASSVANLATYAAYGITTVFSLGDETPAVFAARRAQQSTPPSHARVFLAGPVLAPTTAAEARQQVADVVQRGVDIVKIRVDDNLGTAKKMSPEVYRAVVDEAHARGQRVAVHLYCLADARALLAAGADFIAHSVRDSLVDASFSKALATSGVCYTPTLMREVSTFVYESTPALASPRRNARRRDALRGHRLVERAGDHRREPLERVRRHERLRRNLAAKAWGDHRVRLELIRSFLPQIQVRQPRRRTGGGPLTQLLHVKSTKVERVHHNARPLVAHRVAMAHGAQLARDFRQRHVRVRPAMTNGHQQLRLELDVGVVVLLEPRR
ncbi:MAG: amidohydrolase family protein [Gemmatimonas sp.]